MNLRSTVSSLFNIRPGEGKFVALLLSHSFFVGITIGFFLTAASAIFLAEFDASMLPYVNILSAIVVTLAGFIHSKAVKRFSARSFLIGTLAFLTLFICAIHFGIWLTNARWLIFGSLIWFRVVMVLLYSEFWGLAARLFNVRQGKRLFGLIGSGEFFARILGGLSTPLIISFTGTPNLLLIAASGLVFSLVILFIIIRKAPERFSPSQEEKPKTTKTSANLLQNRYVLLIFCMFVLSVVGTYFIDFVLFDQTKLRYSDQDELARFFGLFFGIATFVVFLFTTFLSGRLITRYSLKFGLLVLPVVCMAGILSVAFTGTVFGYIGIFFWLVVFTKFCEEVLKGAFYKPSVRVLYTPIRSDQRLAAQVAIEGRGMPIGVGIAGVILLIYTWIGFSKITYLAYGILGILILCIALSILVFREYLVVLMQALTKRSLSDPSLSLADSSSVAVLQQGLASPHVGVVLYSLDILEEIEPESFPSVLQDLLGHPEREVRLDVLRRIERLDMSSAAQAIRQRVKYETSTSVRGVSLRTLAALGDPEVFDEIYAYLEDPDPLLRRGAMVGFLRSGELEGILAAVEKLIPLVNSPNPVEREFAAQVLGEGGIRSFYRPLLKLLQDKTLQVQRAALIAAGKVQHPKVWPVVVENLVSPKLRTAAVAALVAGGEAVLPELQAAFTKEGQAREVLIRLARICGRIRGKNTIALLRNHLAFPDEQVRSQVLIALSQCGYRAGDDEKVSIQQHIQVEVAHATWTLATLVDVGDDETVWLLKQALHNNLIHHRTRLFLWLSFLYDSRLILQARDNLMYASIDTLSGDRRACALEIIDVLVSPELKAMLMPLFDDLDPTQRLQRLNAIFPQQRLNRNQRLQEIITEPNEWLNPWSKTCALYTVVQVSAVELAETVVSALSVPDRLVRETAAWTLFRLNPGLYDRYAVKLAQDPNPQIFRAIKQLETEQKGEKVMLSTVEKVMRLKAVSFFSETPEEVLAEVASMLEELEISSGETILKKGDTGNAMYMIVEGQVRLHDGERNVTDLGENDVFGELSLLDPGPHPASVTALTDTRLLCLEQETFYELIEDHSTVAWKIIQILARQLRRAQAQVRPGRPTGDVLSEIHEKLTKT